MSANASTASRRPDYVAYGEVKKMLAYTGKELVFSGPAGTGKSRGGLEKLDALCRHFSNIRALICRKTRASLTQTTLVEYEQKVLGNFFSPKPSARHIYYHGGDGEYRYPNKSVAVVAGLDNSVKIMSGQYDFILVDEATQATETDWENLTTRLRNGMMSFRQLLGLVNPDSPRHFLKQREQAGKLRMFYAQHSDNPRLFNHKTNEWTKEGVEYLEILNDLTGVRKSRLKDGIWCMTDGMVFDGFDQAVHLFDFFGYDSPLLDEHGNPLGNQILEPPRDWQRSLSIDFGFTNPFVCQFWAEDPDGRLYLYREIYLTKRIVELHAEQIIEICEKYDEPAISLVITDHDAQERATLEKHLSKNWRFTGLKTTAAHKAVRSGIDAVQSRLKKQGDGRPRIMFKRDAVVQIDKDLQDAKKPVCTIDEIWSYVFDPKRDEPVKENDHGADGVRYRVAHSDLKAQNTTTVTRFRR